MIDTEYLPGTIHVFHGLRNLAEKAIEQLPEEKLFVTLGEDENSIVILMKHLSGNMLSRWTDFLTTDGEKATRNRDAEFEVHRDDTLMALRERWNAGWHALFHALETLRPEDLSRSVNIRGEPHTVFQAIQRQVSHYGYHVGQIVQLARHHAGDNWKTLSIPKGKSDDARLAGGSYLKPK